jgi:hypothetical protein
MHRSRFHIPLASAIAAVILLSGVAAADPDTADKAPPEFVPTNEWQDVLPGQSIPPGYACSALFRAHACWWRRVAARAGSRFG